MKTTSSYRSRWIGILAALALLPAVYGSNANAGQIVQTFNMLSTPTDISGSLGTGTFNYFQSAGAPVDAVLDSVELRIEVAETVSLLTVKNNDQNNSQTFSYVSYSNIGVVGTAPNADKSWLDFQIQNNGGSLGDIDLIDTGDLTYGPGEIQTFAPPDINSAVDSGLVASLNSGLYDTTGSFTLGFTTTTFQAFVGGGGNGSNQQETSAVGTVTVIYNFTVVPEPSSVVLGAMGVCGLGFIGWRRRRS